MPSNTPLVRATDPGILQAEAEAAAFLEFQRNIDERNPIMDGLFHVTETDAADQDFSIIQSLPAPRIWAENESRTYHSMQDVSINIVVSKWQDAVQWSRTKREDDQLDMIVPSAERIGGRFAQLDERVAIQLLEAATNPDLLPSVPNAYDGTALFSGSSRFGNANGNQISGSGVSIVNNIIDDLYAAQERFASFNDTQGEPYFLDDDVSFENFRIVAPNGSRKVFMEALANERVPAGALTSQSNASVQNPFYVDAGDMSEYIHFSTRLSDANDWYVYLDVPFAKPLVKVERTGLETERFDASNSDKAFDQDIEGVGFRKRTGYGIGAPRVIIKISNS